MSTIKSDNSNLILNADGVGNEVKFHTNGVEVAKISSEKVLVGKASSDTTDLIQIESPANGGGHGIYISRNDSNTDQGIGRIQFGNNTDTDLVTISAKTDGAVDSGALLFSTQVASGSSTEQLKLTSDGRGLSQFTAFAWANIGLDNVAAGNTSPDGSHNISSVTLVSAGKARFNFTNIASTASVSSQCTTNYMYIKCNGTTTSYVDITTYASNQVAINASLVNVATFGGN